MRDSLCITHRQQSGVQFETDSSGGFESRCLLFLRNEGVFCRRGEMVKISLVSGEDADRVGLYHAYYTTLFVGTEAEWTLVGLSPFSLATSFVLQIPVDQRKNHKTLWEKFNQCLNAVAVIEFCPMAAEGVG